MRRIGVEDEPGRDAPPAQRRVPLLSLPDRAAHVGGALVDERRRIDGVDTCERRHLLVPVASVPPQFAQLELAQVVAHVGRTEHADEVADDPAGDRCRKPLVATRQVAGHETAVAVAGDREPIRVGDALGDELVDRLEEVLRIGLAPGAEGAGVEVGAVPVAAARVQEQHRPAARHELLVVEVPVVDCAVPRVVRPAVDVEEKRRRRGSVRVANEPPVHDGAVRDRELALLADEDVELRSTLAVLGAHRLRTRREVEDDDLAERRRRHEHDRGGPARDGEGRHDA